MNVHAFKQMDLRRIIKGYVDLILPGLIIDFK